MSTDAEPRPATGSRRRDTRQRRLLREYLAESPGFISAQELHAQVREDGDKVGLATVYRTLTSMSEAGELDLIRTDDGETRYRQCGPRHHHHLTCRRCSRTVELDGPAVERWADQEARDHGFSQVEHVVEIFGLCPVCTAEQAGTAADGGPPASS